MEIVLVPRQSAGLGAASPSKDTDRKRETVNFALTPSLSLALSCGLLLGCLRPLKPQFRSMSEEHNHVPTPAGHSRITRFTLRTRRGDCSPGRSTNAGIECYCLLLSSGHAGSSLPVTGAQTDAVL